MRPAIKSEVRSVLCCDIVTYVDICSSSHVMYSDTCSAIKSAMSSDMLSGVSSDMCSFQLDVSPAVSAMSSEQTGAPCAIGARNIPLRKSF